MCDDLDEMLVLRQYKQAKAEGHGELEVGIKDGKLVKLWRLDKVDLDAELASLRKLREVPR